VQEPAVVGDQSPGPTLLTVMTVSVIGRAVSLPKKRS
jgi:hypothetical protein